eukprot:TRINITY_DN41461_c0_g1_i1.p1 TRINITY_DN41461_c0_g1~~TRINITY_DN41461_c0_g1_i1.p1  ORF type:complete len:508 (+),score=65.08 TRINITY_DN41461_c0_g1_i1:34-1557(+)
MATPGGNPYMPYGAYPGAGGGFQGAGGANFMMPPGYGAQPPYGAPQHAQPYARPGAGTPPPLADVPIVIGGAGAVVGAGHSPPRPPAIHVHGFGQGAGMGMGAAGSPAPSPPVSGGQKVVVPPHLVPILQQYKQMVQQGVMPQRVYEQKKLELLRNAGAIEAPGAVPAMGGEREESVRKLVYNWDTKQWTQTEVTVVLDLGRPFSEGAMRAAYHMVDKSLPEGKQRCVAKIMKPTVFKPELIRVDAEMQACCQALADAFNARNPPKRVRFVDAYLIQRHGAHAPHEKTLAVEPYMDGKYKKYNNNYGWADDRNTPQAFSHFTHEYTKHKLMVVDIQGVDDMYTDPQIHTHDKQGFGAGNVGPEGIKKFYDTHICNSVCRYLRLPQRTAQFKPGHTAAIGQAPTADGHFKPSDFIGPIKPQQNSAHAEDLAILGISANQFNNLVAEFQRVDLDKNGSLDRSEIHRMLELVDVRQRGRKLQQLINILDAKEDKQHITFKEFCCCWCGVE